MIKIAALGYIFCMMKQAGTCIGKDSGIQTTAEPQNNALLQFIL